MISILRLSHVGPTIRGRQGSLLWSWHQPKAIECPSELGQSCMYIHVSCVFQSFIGGNFRSCNELAIILDAVELFIKLVLETPAVFGPTTSLESDSVKCTIHCHWLLLLLFDLAAINSDSGLASLECCSVTIITAFFFVALSFPATVHSRSGDGTSSLELL
jgi:hypothetical protein